jgi:peptidoglycan/xylan/chitin deacetylase (PgdA/CDA1 family)
MADRNLRLATAVVRAAGAQPIRQAVSLIARRTRALRGLAGVLTYHRIVEDDLRSVTPGIASATATTFARQIDDLVPGFEVVSMADLLAAHAGIGRLPDRSLAITFDDGYQDFADVAWPILRRRGLPVTLFVVTGFVGGGRGGFWWDRLHAAIVATPRGTAVLPGCGKTALGTPRQRTRVSGTVMRALKELDHRTAQEITDTLVADLCPDPPTPPILDWVTLRQLASDGVTLAPHTATHPLLNRVPIDQARQEVAVSIADLRRETGSSAPAFAYPSGALTDAVAAMLPDLGIRLAFTTRRGINDIRRADPMRLNRINVGARSDAAVIRAQLVAHALMARASREPA